VRLFLVTLAVLAAACSAQPSEQALAATMSGAPVGFGRDVAIRCTEASCTCEVTNLDDDPRRPPPGSLRACAERQGPLRIVFAARGTIDLAVPLRVGDDTAIDGRPRAIGEAPVVIAAQGRLGILIENVRNVIVRDLAFTSERAIAAGGDATCSDPERPADTLGCGVPLMIRGRSSNVWIDHNLFERCGGKCVAVWTGGRRGDAHDDGGDLVTLSHNIFRDSYFGVLVGAARDLASEELPEHMRVTMYGNLFDNIFRRSPRAASFSQIHFFNNVVANWGRPGAGCSGRNFGWASSATGGGQLLLENNVYIARNSPDACRLAAEVSDYDPDDAESRGEGLVRASGNRLLNRAEITQNEAESVFDPRDRTNADTAYSYDLLDVGAVEAHVRSNAGPRDAPAANDN